jgi:N-acetylglucosaminyldiphosphoundecaprenol N-acetyl-beta-D-mannosaminyltransferase
MDINIEEWTIDDLHQFISHSVDKNDPIEVLNVNINAMNLIFQDSKLYEILKSADCVFCDGEGVRLVANIQGAKIPYKITYADWMGKFLPFCENRGYRLFLLGSTSDVLEKAVDQIQIDYPKLTLCGYMNGFEDFAVTKQAIVNAKPQIILSGMGMPLQEKVIRRLKLASISGVYLSGGAVFDYLSKEVKRAPRWMVSFKLEWLFRFFLEPKRLFTRYFVGNPLFFWRVFKKKRPI